MSIQAKLHVDGNVYTIKLFSHSIIQPTNIDGFPCSKPQHTGLLISIDTVKDTLFDEWSVAEKMTKQIEIHFIPNVIGQSRTRILKCYDCYLVNFSTDYVAYSNEPATFHLSITCGGIEPSWSQGKYSENWRKTFPDDTPPTTVIEEDVPQITSLEWVNSDTQEVDITEISYKENASLIAVIENPEGSTATITIEKEDGSEFANGETTLSFTESINEEGIIELTPLEIKEQWEEFKTSDIDKLVAKVTHGEVVKNSKPLKVTPKPKVLVNFRPHNGYKGEYGFDWMRMADTSKSGDVWYKQILGGYPAGKFLVSNTAYVNFGKEFDQETHPTKPKDIYIVPILSLLPNKSAKFSLKVEVTAANAKKIEYVYDTSLFTLSKKEVPYKTIGKKTLPDDLEITCIKEFAADEYIEVLADGQFSGKLKILANNKTNRYKADIVFVHVETDLRFN